MFTQLIRIGRDAELRYTANGKAVIGLACAYDIGFGENKKTQWIECAIWEKRAESLAPYLLKGQQAMVTLTDVELDKYESNGTPGSKLKARVVDIQLCGAKPEGKPQQHPQDQQARQAPQQQASAPQGMEDFDDDIPF